MDTFWLMMVAMTVGAAAMKLNDWLTAKGAGGESQELVLARRRVFHDRAVSSRDAVEAAHQLEVSEELRRVLDVITADMADQANLRLMDRAMTDPMEAMRLAGVIRGASEFADALVNVRSGEYAKMIEIEERKLQAEHQ